MTSYILFGVVIFLVLVHGTVTTWLIHRNHTELKNGHKDSTIGLHERIDTLEAKIAQAEDSVKRADDKAVGFARALSLSLASESEAIRNHVHRVVEDRVGVVEGEMASRMEATVKGLDEATQAVLLQANRLQDEAIQKGVGSFGRHARTAPGRNS